MANVNLSAHCTLQASDKKTMSLHGLLPQIGRFWPMSQANAARSIMSVSNRLRHGLFATSIRGKPSGPAGQPVPLHRAGNERGGPLGAARRSMSLLAAVRRSFLCQLLLQLFQVEARALLHRRELDEGLRGLRHFLLHKHEAPELEREPVRVEERVT